MTLEELQQTVTRIKSLLDDPQPGLMSWVGALHSNMEQLKKWWGDGRSD